MQVLVAGSQQVAAQDGRRISDDDLLACADHEVWVGSGSELLVYPTLWVGSRPQYSAHGCVCESRVSQMYCELDLRPLKPFACGAQPASALRTATPSTLQCGVPRGGLQ